MTVDVDVEDGFEVGEASVGDDTEDGDQRLEDQVVDLASVVLRRIEDAKEGVEDVPQELANLDLAAESVEGSRVELEEVFAGGEHREETHLTLTSVSLSNSGSSSSSDSHRSSLRSVSFWV